MILTRIAMGPGIAKAILYQSLLDEEEPPSELDVLLFRAGISGPLQPLTPLAASPSHTPLHSSPPMSTFQTLAGASASLESLAHPLLEPQRHPFRSNIQPPSASEAGLDRAERSRRARAQRKRDKKQREYVERWRRHRVDLDRLRQSGKASFAKAAAYQVRPELSKKFKRVKTLKCDVDASSLPACKGAWKGKYEKEGTDVITLEEATTELGLKLVEWDGR